jgi:hypothetical protein
MASVVVEAATLLRPLVLVAQAAVLRVTAAQLDSLQAVKVIRVVLAAAQESITLAVAVALVL